MTLEHARLTKNWHNRHLNAQAVKCPIMNYIRTKLCFALLKSIFAAIWTEVFEAKMQCKPPRPHRHYWLSSALFLTL